MCPSSRPRTDRGHLLLRPPGGYTEIRGRCRAHRPLGLPPTKPEGRLKAGYPRLLRPPRPVPLQPGADSPRASRRVVHDRPGRDSDPESFAVRAIELSRDFARYSPIVRPWQEGDTRRPLPRRLRRQSRCRAGVRIAVTEFTALGNRLRQCIPVREERHGH
jgi:hypothetical protein